MSQPSVKIVGLPRSGTRYMTMLMQNNYSVLVDAKGKHQTPSSIEHRPADVVLAISKRFDRWLTSTIRAGYEYDITKTRMYHHLDRGHTPKTLAGLFACAHDVYKKFYDEWADQPNVVPVRYEDMLVDSEAYLGPIAAKYGWPRQPAVTAWNDQGPDKMPSWRLAYYLEGQK